MRPMPRWHSIMRGMCIPGVTRGSVFGWSALQILWPVHLPSGVPCLSPPIPRFTAIRLFSKFQKKWENVMTQTINTQEALEQFLLRMGDNTLILGHRVSEWCGHAPVLEE